MVRGGTGWYLVAPGQYNSVLLGIKWYWVSKVLLCLYILTKNRDLVGCHRNLTHTLTDNRT